MYKRQINYRIERREPLKEELRAFVQAVSRREPPVVSAWDGLAALGLAMQLIESSHNGQPIMLSQPVPVAQATPTSNGVSHPNSPVLPLIPPIPLIDSRAFGAAGAANFS